MKKRIIEAIKLHWKWIIPVGYLLAAFWGWQHKSDLFALIPIRENAIPFYSLYRMALDVLYVLIATLGLAGLVQEIKVPYITKVRFASVFQQAGLKNKLDEYPTLYSVYKDKHKRYGLVYALKSKGITTAGITSVTEQLETTLNIKIKRIGYGSRTSSILIYALPQKHARPTVISPNDESLGVCKISSLINALVVGATGTGKTVAIKIIMAKIVKFQPTATIWVLDFKQYDFKELADRPNYYAYTDCAKGLNEFYDAFKAQQSTGVAGYPQYLICDEWGSFILSCEKRQAEELKSQLSELLMLGRSYRYIPIIGIQRADVSYFHAGARDNFKNIIALGKLSREQENMLFSEYKDKLAEHSGQGEGYMLTDGHEDVERVKIARIKDIDALNECIRNSMF